MLDYMSSVAVSANYAATSGRQVTEAPQGPGSILVAAAHTPARKGRGRQTQFW